MESSYSTSIPAALPLKSPLNSLFISLSLALSIHSPCFASSHPPNSICLSDIFPPLVLHLPLHSILPLPPPPFSFPFLHLSSSLPKQDFCMLVMSQVCASVCLCQRISLSFELCEWDDPPSYGLPVSILSPPTLLSSTLPHTSTCIKESICQRCQGC